MRVNEVFQTIQGEGVAVGQPALFLRLYGCNQHCAWCDTFYTWDTSRSDEKVESREMTPEAVVRLLREFDSLKRLVVISGGEPALQQVALLDVIQRLPDDWTFDMETAGSLALRSDLLARLRYVVCSPKLGSSGNDVRVSQNLHVLQTFARSEKTRWKFVVANDMDWAEATAFVSGYNLPRDKVWMMPCGATPEQLALTGPFVAERCARFGYQYSDRTHIRLWGTQRGR